MCDLVKSVVLSEGVRRGEGEGRGGRGGEGGVLLKEGV